MEFIRLLPEERFASDSSIAMENFDRRESSIPFRDYRAGSISLPPLPTSNRPTVSRTNSASRTSPVVIKRDSTAYMMNALLADTTRANSPFRRCASSTATHTPNVSPGSSRRPSQEHYTSIMSPTQIQKAKALARIRLEAVSDNLAQHGRGKQIPPSFAKTMHNFVELASIGAILLEDDTRRDSCTSSSSSDELYEEAPPGVSATVAKLIIGDAQQEFDKVETAMGHVDMKSAKDHARRLLAKLGVILKDASLLGVNYVGLNESEFKWLVEMRASCKDILAL
ncbi:Hypothetical predicted protein [Lecanosticta acicola]|uniref:Uncharacterized protein n=1 Tax=Lecanosticta acicola TaxID=111012 RepID=A0AAI8W1E6_9PEZI|nr:Hypothetical predicted protein [Lecanosticta acicola]